MSSEKQVGIILLAGFFVLFLCFKTEAFIQNLWLVVLPLFLMMVWLVSDFKVINIRDFEPDGYEDKNHVFLDRIEKLLQAHERNINKILSDMLERNERNQLKQEEAVKALETLKKQYE